MRKHFPSILWLAIGLAITMVALGSENCLPYQAGQCLLRKDGENIVAIVIGVIVVLVGIFKLLKRKR